MLNPAKRFTEKYIETDIQKKKKKKMWKCNGINKLF